MGMKQTVFAGDRRFARDLVRGGQRPRGFDAGARPRDGRAREGARQSRAGRPATLPLPLLRRHSLPVSVRAAGQVLHARLGRRQRGPGESGRGGAGEEAGAQRRANGRPAVRVVPLGP